MLVGLFALALAMFLLRPILKSRPAQEQFLPMLDTSAAPALGTAQAAKSGSDTLPMTPVVSAAIPEIDFSPAAGASADPVDRLKELMKARKDESLKVLSGWIEKREDAV